MKTRTGLNLEKFLSGYSTAVLESEEVEAPEFEAPKRWEGVIVVEGTPTGDGRLIEKGALKWDVSADNPILMRFVKEDVGAHDGAQVVGRIDTITRQDDGSIWAEGDFDNGSEIGREAQRHVEEKLTRGVSVDLDEVSFEVRIAQDVLDEAMLVEPEETSDGEEEELEVDDEGRVIVAKMEKDDELFVTTEARIRAATLVATPAFDEAYISMTDSEGPGDSAGAGDDSYDALIAAAAPISPPSKWFSNPGLSGATPLTVEDDGRIYGHVATWDTCHIANPGGDGQCVLAPRSKTDYSYFHTGTLHTKDGKKLGVGHITMDTGHAKPAMKVHSAANHYDNTGTTVADVRAGEDSHGIWVAGALRPRVTAEQVRALRSSPLSGDWRAVAGNLEMVAALAVNVPGFPIPRPQGMVASGDMASLLAAGMVPPKKVRTRSEDKTSTLSEGDLKYLKRLADHGRKLERESMSEKVSQAKAQMNRRKIESFRSKKGR